MVHGKDNVPAGLRDFLSPLCRISHGRRHTYAPVRHRRATLILARRQSETNANLINQKAADNAARFVFSTSRFPLSVLPFLFAFFLRFRVHAIFILLDMYSGLFFVRLVLLRALFISVLIGVGWIVGSNVGCLMVEKVAG